MTSRGITENGKSIDSILQKNAVNDLNKFIKKRDCLNTCNLWFIYLFHFLQTCGMITTSLSASYEFKGLVWVGIAFNAAASLVSIYEKTNQAVSDQLLENIKVIKAGEYIDEPHFEGVDKK